MGMLLLTIRSIDVYYNDLYCKNHYACLQNFLNKVCKIYFIHIFILNSNSNDIYYDAIKNTLPTLCEERYVKIKLKIIALTDMIQNEN